MTLNIEHSQYFTPFPIDVVYTWVNGSDKEWLLEFNNTSPLMNIRRNELSKRYIDCEELRYSLRLLEQNAPWIRKIFIVVHKNQRPSWINIHHPKIRFISHSQIYPKSDLLPIFNSNSIEFAICNIPGLSEHFIYLNDDMFICQPTSYKDFFSIDGKPRIIVKHKEYDNYSIMEKKYNNLLENKMYRYDSSALFATIVHRTLLLFTRKFNITMPYEYDHIPLSLNKRLIRGLYQSFPYEIIETLSNRLRNITDLQFQTMTIQYGTYTHNVIPVISNDNNHLFIMAAHPLQKGTLFSILHHLPKFLCVNIDADSYRPLMMEFYQLLAPNASSFEIKNMSQN